MTRLQQDLPAARKASAEAQANVKAENAKHTPMPWFVAAKGKHVVCTINTLYKVCADVPPAVDAEADANLIAAAPELLYALKACAAVCAGETMSKQGLINALEKARAAISKAQGAPHE